MKTVETPGGIPVFISTYESQVYESITDEVAKSSLSERDAHIAQQLVEKNILKRVIRDGKTYYKRNKGSL